MERPTDKASAPDTPAPKKAYKAPVLMRWGTMKELTQASGASGKKDGAGKKSTYNRTH